MRSEIEELSRVKKEMEMTYSKSFDGKERLEISENKALLMSKLKRLQKELHDLIGKYANIPTYASRHYTTWSNVIERHILL